MSTGDPAGGPAQGLDASEVDPDPGATAELPGYSAADRTAPGEPPAGAPHPDPRQEPAIQPPAQDRPDARGAR